MTKYIFIGLIFLSLGCKKYNHVNIRIKNTSNYSYKESWIDLGGSKVGHFENLNPGQTSEYQVLNSGDASLFTSVKIDSTIVSGEYADWKKSTIRGGKKYTIEINVIDIKNSKSNVTLVKD